MVKAPVSEGTGIVLSVEVDRLHERIKQLEHDLALERRINTSLVKRLQRAEHGRKVAP